MVKHCYAPANFALPINNGLVRSEDFSPYYEDLIMRIVRELSLISVGTFEESSDWGIIRREIRDAISLIVHPPGTSSFTINPTRHGNGVKPIKEAGMTALKDRFGWELETQVQYATKSPGKVDATKVIDHHLFAFEWETGNISSSHRSVSVL